MALQAARECHGSTDDSTGAPITDVVFIVDASGASTRGERRDMRRPLTLNARTSALELTTISLAMRFCTQSFANLRGPVS